ncbi:MAG: monofunctional biosynthetic peptidoglycan transglycosylase [Verrucomicrobia bacterium]|nr:monofunctional biosynthetic peptidoglycan transglycosylase [Verrucomicrobiota bacterium]
MSPSAGRSNKSNARPARSPWRKRLVKWSLLALLALAVLPVLEVGCVRFVNPPGTPLMALRYVEAQCSRGAHPPRVLYRWRPWREVPDDFLRGVWALEDARFFRHHGFDWIEMNAAVQRAERTGGTPRGSSTITMQCARSLFLWQHRDYVRKALEAYYTFWMETLLSKRRIFELYVNVIELGDGVYGLGAASEFWFKKTPGALSADECALLAAMPPAPRRWNPRAPSRRLRARQERALRELPLLHWPPGVR